MFVSHAITRIVLIELRYESSLLLSFKFWKVYLELVKANEIPFVRKTKDLVLFKEFYPY